MADQKGNQGGFPQNQTTGQDTYSTTGDGHPPRPGERQTEENMAGQSTGQMGGSQQNQQQNRGSQQSQGQGAGAGSSQSSSGRGQSGSGNS